MSFVYPKMEVPSCSEKLAKFVSNLSFKDIPEAAVDRIKDTVLDTIGCGIAGRNTKASLAALAVIQDMGNKPEASVVGIKEKFSSSNAAFLNAIMSKCLDFDGPQIGGHQSPILIPVSFALAEKNNLSGKEIIEAIVAGIEVMARVRKALGPRHQIPQGFHPTSTAGIFGATAAAGKMLGLSETMMMRAFGVAGSCVSGTDGYLQDGSWTNCLHCAKPAVDGILSASLAQKGFTGERWIFEGLDGVLQCYSLPGTTDASKLVEGLGNIWNLIERPRFAGYKRYASCGSMHTCLDVFKQVMDEHLINPDDVVEVTVWTNFSNFKYNVAPFDRRIKPASIVEGIFSMPFCIGMLAYRKEVTPHQWNEEGILKDDKILSFAKKVKPLVDYGINPPRAATVKIKTKIGSIYENVNAFRIPFTAEELERKFVKNNTVGKVLNEDGVKKLEQLVRRLDKITDINSITDLFSGRI